MEPEEFDKIAFQYAIDHSDESDYKWIYTEQRDDFNFDHYFDFNIASDNNIVLSEKDGLYTLLNVIVSWNDGQQCLSFSKLYCDAPKDKQGLKEWIEETEYQESIGNFDLEKLSPYNLKLKSLPQNTDITLSAVVTPKNPDLGLLDLELKDIKIVRTNCTDEN